MSPNVGGGGTCGVSANENSCAHHVQHGAQINFGDLTPHLTTKESEKHIYRKKSHWFLSMFCLFYGTVPGGR
jgi:hypothetical protein